MKNTSIEGNSPPRNLQDPVILRKRESCAVSVMQIKLSVNILAAVSERENSYNHGKKCGTITEYSFQDCIVNQLYYKKLICFMLRVHTIML